jgi:hypothetical protein
MCAGAACIREAKRVPHLWRTRPSPDIAYLPFARTTPLAHAEAVEPLDELKDRHDTNLAAKIRLALVADQLLAGIVMVQTKSV